ncbi:transposase [Pseudomonas sp. IT-196MI5]
MDCALTFVAGGLPVKLVSECLGVARSQLTVRIKQSVSPKTRRSRPLNDAELVAEIQQQVSDNGSAYTAEQTRSFAWQIGLQPATTPVRSPQSNGMAESFVKTIKRDYVAHIPKPDQETALRNLAIAFEHYNEKHPHSALNYRSPREFRRLAAASI